MPHVLQTKRKFLEVSVRPSCHGLAVDLDHAFAHGRGYEESPEWHQQVASGVEFEGLYKALKGLIRPHEAL